MMLAFLVAGLLAAVPAQGPAVPGTPPPVATAAGLTPEAGAALGLPRLPWPRMPRVPVPKVPMPRP